MAHEGAARRFRWGLIALVLAGFGLRLAYILIDRQHITFGGDAFYYHAGANLLADGRGFIDPFHPGTGNADAHHPPLYTLWLTIPSVLGLRTQLAHLIWSAVLGAGTIGLVGLTGREIGGERLGLIAAALAAVAPNLWIPDGSLMAETVTMFATAAALLGAYRYWKRPRWSTLALVGVAAGAGALSRSEVLLLLPLLVVPLALFVPNVSRRDRWTGIGAAGVAAGLVLTPWVAFNLTRFEKPELLSTQFGLAMSSTNCDRVWRSDFKSYFSQLCSIEVDEKLPPGLDPSEQDAEHRKVGIRYVREHLDELPGVVAARLGAIVGLYHPTRQIAIDGSIEGRGNTMAHLSMYSFYLLAVLSIVGGVLLRRRRTVPVFPLVAPLLTVAITVVLIYASTRFRSTAEVALCLLAAVTLDSIVARVGTGRGPARSAPRSTESSVPRASIPVPGEPAEPGEGG